VSQSNFVGRKEMLLQGNHSHLRLFVPGAPRRPIRLSIPAQSGARRYRPGTRLPFVMELKKISAEFIIACSMRRLFD
jgi:hypothetical protein